MQVSREHLETVVRVLQEENKKVNEMYDQDAQNWKKERQELHKRIQDLVRNQEHMRQEGGKYMNLKDKYLDYKEKVKKANANIQTLM